MKSTEEKKRLMIGTRVVVDWEEQGRFTGTIVDTSGSHYVVHRDQDGRQYNVHPLFITPKTTN